MKPTFITLLALTRATSWNIPNPRRAKPIRYTIKSATNCGNMNISTAMRMSTVPFTPMRGILLFCLSLYPSTSETMPEARRNAAMMRTASTMASVLLTTITTPMARAATALMMPLNLLLYPNVIIIFLYMHIRCKCRIFLLISPLFFITSQNEDGY